MRADLLTKNQDEKYGHFSTDPSELQDRELSVAKSHSSLYTGQQQSGSSEPDNRVIKDKETQGSFVNKSNSHNTHGNKPIKLWQLLASKKLRGKSSLLAVIVLLFGGGSFLTALLAPSAAIIQLKEVFTQSLNDQLKAIDSRSASIMRAKFKSTTTGSCGVVKIKCDFATMSESQARAFEARDKRFKIELADVNDSRGKISKITFSDDGKSPIQVTDAKQFSGLLAENQAFRSAWSGVYNVPYESVSDPKAREIIRDKAKATKNTVLSGENDEERQKKLNQVTVAGESADTKNLVKKTDRDGNTTYTDDNGRTYTQAEYDKISQSADRIEKINKSGGQSGIIANTSKVLSIDQVGENVCTTYNFMRHTSAMAKLVKKQQAIRFALALVLTMADKIKAGDATEDEVNFAGNNIMTTQPDKEVVDDSKLTSTATGVIPMIGDPEAGNSGLNAPSYNMAAYGDVPTLSSRAAKFTLTGGSIAIIDSITTGVARIVNGGNPDPKQISKKCGYIQSPLVRVGALGLGIAAGVMTFGTWQAAGIAASVAFSLAQPSLEAAAGDMVAGDAFKDISGIDSVDAAYVGTAGLTGDIGGGRGMLPVVNEEGKDYINGNKQVLNTFIKDQQYLAKATPFDVSNRYSFVGSMLFAATPTILTSRTNMSVAMMNVASLIPKTFAQISAPVGASAVNDQYFELCPDTTYKAMGIKAGPFCEVRYYMPKNSLDLDPLENAQWMSDSGNIDPDSDTGSAVDNGERWNYVKYLAQCANRTVGWGENENENDGDGSECFSPENEPLNMHFRAYTMDLSINGGMKDGNTNTSTPTNTGNITQTNKGQVGPNGWAFPTNSDQTIIRGFSSDHKGVDIAAGSIEQTNLQPIYAARDGVVVSTGKQSSYGNWVVIKHNNVDNKTLYSVYSNIDNRQIIVSVGQKVTAGDMIAKIGSSNEINGPHLHFEIWDGEPLTSGTLIDPTVIIEGSRIVSSATRGSV